jgi:hypothetical protein
MSNAPRNRGRRRSGTGGGAARGWCCSFAGAPQNPDLRPLPPTAAASSPGVGCGAGGGGSGGWGRKLPPKSPSAPSFSGSPASSRLSSLGGLIDPRRILSPGRVSPIDPDGAVPPAAPLQLPPPLPATVAVDSMELVPVEPATMPTPTSSLAVAPVMAAQGEGDGSGLLDLRLFLKGRDGRCVLMELDSRVLCGCSAFFASMAPRGADSGKRIDVDGVENLEAFKAAVELMYQPDPVRWLAGSGVLRAIDVLEVRSRNPPACLS